MSKRNEKSQHALKTISEVSDVLDVPQHVLRFWEDKFPQISPLKRRGGRRYYRPEDVATIQAIKGLLYDEGFTIKGALKYLRSNPLNASKDTALNDNDKSSEESATIKQNPAPLITSQEPLQESLKLLREAQEMVTKYRRNTSQA